MMSESVRQHQAEAPRRLAVAVITVSDTRTVANDTSGAFIIECLEAVGHHVVGRDIVPDQPDRIRPLLLHYRQHPDVAAVLLTGGTGISSRDLTFETVSVLLTKPLPGFGELFRMLSYAEIGAASILSRAVGGLMETTVVLLMPGSRAAVELAMTKIIIPELPHLVREARR